MSLGLLLFDHNLNSISIVTVVWSRAERKFSSLLCTSGDNDWKPNESTRLVAASFYNFAMGNAHKLSVVFTTNASTNTRMKYKIGVLLLYTTAASDSETIHYRVMAPNIVREE